MPTARPDDQANLVKKSTPIDGTAASQAVRETVADDLLQDAEQSALEIQEFKDVIEHRKKWSDTLLIMVQLIIALDFVIMFLIGLDVLHYGGLAVPAFIGSSVLEVFGLSYIVVQYLFPGGKPAKRGKKLSSERLPDA